MLQLGPYNNTALLQSSLRIVSNIGQVTQVRNHVKRYPWRSNRNNRECYLDPTEKPYTDRFNINEFNKKRKKKPWQEVIPKDKDNRFNSYTWNDSYKSCPKEAKETSESKLHRFQDSLRNRGEARERKPYSPPYNVQEKVLTLFKSLQIPDDLGKGSVDLETDEAILSLDLRPSKALKHNLIINCMKEFNHDMPSSYLNEMDKLSDVIDYFSTPVRGVNPYAALLREDDSLPVNLKLISEPLRYNRESDTYFGGYTALPGIVSKVPGLRGSKKYPTLNQDEFQWPDI